MSKRLNYVISISLTMGLLLAVWATSGFREFTQWRSKSFAPFVWGIGILAARLGTISLLNRVATTVERRTFWEIWGRGIISGLMIAIVWACIYLADLFLKDIQTKCEAYLATIGLMAAIGLGLVGAMNERFLTGTS